MKKFLVLFTLAFFVIGITSMNAQPPKKKAVAVSKNAVDKTRGANPNIKQDEPTTDVAMAKPSKNRGDYCTISISNTTGYYVKVYLDGYYKGTLGPYESGTVTAYSGYKTLYCITAGGTYDWSAAGNCDGTFSFTLN